MQWLRGAYRTTNKSKMKVFTPFILAAILVLILKTTGLAYKTDGRIVYGVSGNTTPQARLWNQETSSTGAAAGTQAANTAINWTINKASPTKLENIAGALTTNAGAGSNLYIQRWSGSAWSNEFNVNTANANLASRRSFDVAYENTSGHAMVVYSTGTNPQYRIWNGSSWSVAANVLPVAETATVEWIELASRPNSNEIALLYAINDGDAGYNLRGIIWDGAAWGNQSAVLETNLAYAGAAGDTKSFDAAYEDSGELVVAFGWNNTTNDALAARYVNRPVGGPWAAAADFNTWRDEATFMYLAPEPGADRIVAVSCDSKTQDLQYAIWNGNTWYQRVANADTSMYAFSSWAGKMPVAAGWVTTGASPVAIVAYADNANNAIYWSRWDGVAWGIQTPWNPGHAMGYTGCIDIDKQPGENKVMVTVGDSNGALWAKAYDGSSWINADGGTALQSSLSSTSSVPFDFAFDQFATITRDSGTDPATKTVAKTATNIALDAFRLSTNSGIDILTGLTFAGNTGFTSTNITNVRLYADNGSTPNEWDSGDTLAGTSTIAGTTATFSGLNATVGKTTSQFLIVFDVAGTAASTSVTGTVSAITSTNSSLGSDTGSATITIDAIPPGQATGFLASDGEDMQSSLTWSNPGDSDFLGVRIMRRSDGTYPTGPSDPSAQQVWEDTTAPIATTYTDTGPLSNGTAYRYAVFTRDVVGNWNTTVTAGMNADTGTPGPTITVSNSIVATDAIFQGQTDIAMQKLGFQTNYSTAQVTSVKVDRTGTGVDSDVARVRIFTDLNGNGAIDGADAQVGNGTFSGGTVTLAITPLTVGTSPSYLLVVYDISNASNTHVTAGSNIANQNYIGTTGAYRVASFTGYGSNSLLTINNNTVNVTSIPVANLGHRGNAKTVMQKLGVFTDYGTADLTHLQVDKVGTVPDSTITAVKIYTDLNGNGAIDGADAVIGSNTFSGGHTDISLTSPPVITTTPTYFLVVFAVSNTAVVSDTIGSRIANESYLTVLSPDVVAPFTNYGSNLLTITLSAEPLTVSHTPPSDFSADQGSQNQLLDTIGLSAPDGDGIIVNGLSINKVGSAPDSDISTLRLVRDTNGNRTFEPGTDAELESTTLAGGIARFSLSLEVLPETTETVFVVANLINTAGIGTTIKPSITDTTSLDVCEPDTITAFGPLNGATLTILDKPDTLDISQSAVGGGKFPAGTSDHVMQVLDLSNIEDEVTLTALSIKRTGTATDSDTASNSIKLWYDVDNSGSLNPGDQQLSTAKTFSSGVVAFNGISLSPISPSTPKKLLVTYSLRSDAGVGRTIGASIENTTSLTVGSPDKAALSSIPLSSVVHTITPIPPTIPIGLRITAGSNNKLSLDWNDNPANEYITHYAIYRADAAGGPFNPVGSSNGSQSSFTDTVPSSGNYWYKVSAVNDTDESLKGTTESASNVIADNKASLIDTITIESADAAVKLVIPADPGYAGETFTITSAVSPPAPGIQLVSRYFFNFQTNVTQPFAKPLTVIFRCTRLVSRSDIIYHYNDTDGKWEAVTGGQYIYDDNDPYTIGYTNITHFSGYGVGAAAFGGYNDPLQYVTTPGPHGGYTDTTNKCQECHAVHIATGTYRLTRANVRSETCDFCHGDGGVSIKHIVLDVHGHGVSTDQAQGMITAPDDTDPPYTKDAKLWGCLECHSVHDNQTIKLSDLSYDRLLKSDPNPAKNKNYLHYVPVIGESTQTVSQWCSTCHNANFGPSAELKTVAKGAATGKVAGHSSSAAGSTNTPDGFADVKYDGSGPTCRQCHTANGGSGTSEFPHSSGSSPALLKAGTTVRGIDNVCTGCHNTASMP